MNQVRCGGDELGEAEGGEGGLFCKGADAELDERTKDGGAEGECDGECRPGGTPAAAGKVDEVGNGADTERDPICEADGADELGGEAEEGCCFLRIYEGGDSEEGLELIADNQDGGACHVANEHAARDVLDEVRYFEEGADD